METNERELSQEQLDNLAIIDQMLEENASYVCVDDTTARFKSAEWFEKVQESSILLAGVGGIGSWLTLLLSRMKPKNLYIMDGDTVEMVNMSGQLYSTNDIGKLKVDAIADTCIKYSNYYSIMSIGTNFTEESEAYDIMICGFDNMAARKLYFYKWLDRVKKKPINERKNCLFIDGRLNAEKFQVISITGEDYYGMKKYINDFLFDDTAVTDALCSYKQTTYCAAMIASFMCNVFINFMCHSDARPVLFFQEYDAELMCLKQES
jgi:molybdopterin/thiamine biosynthesis adenylyltransferase